MLGAFRTPPAATALWIFAGGGGFLVTPGVRFGYFPTMENQLNSREAAVASLQQHVSSWLAANPKRSVSSLSRSSGASESSIRRLLNNNTWPVTENVQKIVSFIGGGTHSQVLNSLPVPLQNQLKFELAYLQFEEMQSYVSLGEKEKALSSFAHQTIFARSACGSGISMDEVKEMFGAYGESVVKELESAGLINVSLGKVVCVPEFKNYSISTTLCKSFASESLGAFYKTESPVNYLFCVTEGVSKKGYGKIMDVLENAHKAVLSIVKNEKGEIPLNVSGMMDTMTFKDIFATKNEVES